MIVEAAEAAVPTYVKKEPTSPAERAATHHDLKPVLATRSYLPGIGTIDSRGASIAFQHGERTRYELLNAGTTINASNHHQGGNSSYSDVNQGHLRGPTNTQMAIAQAIAASGNFPNHSPPPYPGSEGPTVVSHDGNVYSLHQSPGSSPYIAYQSQAVPSRHHQVGIIMYAISNL